MIAPYNVFSANKSTVPWFPVSVPCRGTLPHRCQHRVQAVRLKKKLWLLRRNQSPFIQRIGLSRFPEARCAQAPQPLLPLLPRQPPQQQRAHPQLKELRPPHPPPRLPPAPPSLAAAAAAQAAAAPPACVCASGVARASAHPADTASCPRQTRQLASRPARGRAPSASHAC